MKALMIIDVQVDFCPGGALPAPEGDIVVPVINDLINKFNIVIASRDWHPSDTVHFKKWPVHCVQDTKGAEFHPDLNVSKIGKFLLKGTENKDDGYSAFEATNENLANYLKKNEVDELYVCGLTTEYCVQETVLDSLRAGFKTYVIEDAIKGVNQHQDDAKNAKLNMKQEGAKIITSSDIN